MLMIYITRMNPRGRWRRSRNLRRVPTTESANDRGEGTEPADAPFLRSPLFWRYFFLILPLKSHRTDSKSPDKQQTDLSRSRGRLDPVSRHLKRCYRSAKPSKEGPESSSQIPLTSRLMGTSGFLGRWHSPQIAPAAQ